MTCANCGVEIPVARLEALPGVETCVNCSMTPQVKGRMVWDHKTAPTLEVCSPERFANLTHLERRGFHAQLPLQSPNNPRMQAARAKQWDLQGTKRLMQTGTEIECPDAEAVMRHPARCHKDRPRINPTGDCLECALEKQARRIKR